MPDIELLIKELFSILSAYSLYKVPGSFLMEGEEACPFCEDENKIPVVINNNLSAEIRKIPIKLISEETGLTGNQLEEIFRIKEGDEYVLKKYYSDIICRDLLLKNVSPCSFEYLNQNSLIEHTKFSLAAINPFTQPITYEDFLNSLNHPKSSIDPNLIANLMQCKQQINQTQTFDNEQDYFNTDLEKSRYIGHVIQSVVEDYRRKFKISDQKERIRKSDCNIVGKKAIHICRQKDPYLREINLAIFGGLNMTYPKENTEAYHKLAQEYALLGATPLSDESSTSKNDYSPSKSGLSSSSGTVKLSLDIKNEPYKRAAFEDPSVLPDNTSQYPCTSQQLLASGYPSTSDPSNFFAGFAAKGNLLSQNSGCSNNMNPYQIPASFLAYNNLNQKSKSRQSPQLMPQMPLFLTPHQNLLQASQAANYPTTTYPQTLVQPQPNFYNHLQANPFYNASFKETHINTAIIQQQQYHQYNVLAAAAVGSYEMLVYEQMLHQTQKIKTVVARNRMDKRLQSEMAKISLKATTAAHPACSSLSSTSNSRFNDPVNSARMRNLFSQLNTSSSSSLIFNPETVAIKTESSSNSRLSLDKQPTKSGSSTMQQTDPSTSPSA